MKRVVKRMPANKKKNKFFLVLIALTAFFVITITVTSAVLIIKNNKSEDTGQNKTKNEVNSKKLQPKKSNQKASKGSKSTSSPKVVFRRPVKKISVSVTEESKELLSSNSTVAAKTSTTFKPSPLVSGTNATSIKQGTYPAYL